MKLLLANIDYEPLRGVGGHSTDEGMQFQRGLEHAGFVLAGAGYDDGLRNVPSLLERHSPEVVLVHDKRDWDPDSGICFRKGIEFEQLSELAKRKDILKLAVVKDAGSSIDYHRQFCEEIQADAVVTYYHEQSVLKHSPFLKNYQILRTWHTVDDRYLGSIPFPKERKRSVVSGAVSNTYPLRKKVIDNARQLRCDVIRHPGYGNKGSFTPSYLKTISNYRVHVATASAYAFALRKIIESVAVGATPVTNLPAYDCLPEIDGALVRVSQDASISEIREAIDKADREWNVNDAWSWSVIARRHYDLRAMGQRLDAQIAQLKVTA